VTTDTSTTPTTTSLTGDYDFDTVHSRLGFAAKHAMVTTVRGTFDSWTGEAHLDAENVSNSSARIEIDTASINTGHEDRDNHVRNSDFLEVDKYPKITFVATSAEQVDDENYTLTGDLTIKDVTKPITINFERTGAGDDPWGNFRVGFEGKTVINRTDWGVSFNMPFGGGVVVSEKVTLEFDLAVVRRSQLTS
jgi:polyisoprenoid-binding protein YceI